MLIEEGPMEAWWITEAGVQSLAASEVHKALARNDGVVWIDLHHTDEPGMSLLAELILVEPADIQDCHTRSPVPKLRPYADHHFSSINGLARGIDGRLYFQPLKIFLCPRLLFTVLGPSSEALTIAASRRELVAVRRRLEARQLCPQSGFDIVTAIRFEMLRAHEELVVAAADRAAELEQSVMQRDAVTAEALLGDLFRLRHDLQTIRTNTAQTHELYGHVIDMLNSREDLMPLDLRRFRDLQQGFGHVRNTIDFEREYLQEVLDLFQTRVSTELNRFVRKITAFGTIGIAWTVIVGIYGMNFTYMPELNWRFGYPAVIGLMALAGILLAALFRKEHWL
jgi:magnesium transporter